VVESSLYHRIRDTESSGVGAEMLQGRAALPPTTPKIVSVVSRDGDWNALMTTVRRTQYSIKT